MILLSAWEESADAAPALAEAVVIPAVLVGILQLALTEAGVELVELAALGLLP